MILNDYDKKQHLWLCICNTEDMARWNDAIKNLEGNIVKNQAESQEGYYRLFRGALWKYKYYKIPRCYFVKCIYPPYDFPEAIWIRASLSIPLNNFKSGSERWQERTLDEGLQFTNFRLIASRTSNGFNWVPTKFYKDILSKVEDVQHGY